MSFRTVMLLAAAATLSPSLGQAQETTSPTPAAVPKKGFALKDRDGKKIGTVDMVSASGVVTFIRDMRIYRVPLATVSTNGRTSTTSLSWAEIRN
ncbi:hypothetical protein [Sphingomonas turrisvirgatae]|uniref:PRC-barrel domain-containing protein n=1 Tax=Sphingomonas turrisvirgatae TaxID=1888892 RepID=A0A1E3M089_9SPHN|nr:hypothetical protein [Sphingomonas turrisvirgatae]ODP38460.1 hypothetical protein BFL28_13865 [Sphingomonas turrisvirgatae]